jgi:[ribosomal protein S5]-alanine N-acetyltransferase
LPPIRRTSPLEDLALTRLTSGHAEDNPASGRILTKLGFRETGCGEVWSEPRRGMIRQIWYEFRSELTA